MLAACMVAAWVSLQIFAVPTYAANGAPLGEDDFARGKLLFANANKTEARASFDAKIVNHADPPPEPSKGTRFIVKPVSRRWPNGEVPYVLDAAFDDYSDDDWRGLIASAMDDVHAASCIRWRPKEDGDLDWVNIFTTGASGCFGTLGFYGPGHGEHKLSLEGPDSCNDKGVIIHEMLHNLGVTHEHARPDRDTKLTVNWPNLALDKANNHFRHSWETDTDNLPECDVDSQVQGTADFSNCVSGDVVADFGVGYDYNSIMHYGVKFFAVDDSVNVLTPIDTSITDLGGSELTDMDKEKLRKAYGCESCGGWWQSDTGGDLNGAITDAQSPCEYLLETTPGKGITIDITSMSDSTDDCSTDYLEVRLGDSKDGQLFGKFCSGSVSIRNYMVWAKWVRSSEDTSSMAASWSTFEFSCCPTVFLEMLDGQKSNMGTYIKQDTLFKSRGLYKQKDEENFLFFNNGKWLISSSEPDPATSDSGYSTGVTNEALEWCPEEVTMPWQYFQDEIWNPDSDAKLRCSDCTQYPDKPECATCCPKVILENLDGQTSSMGTFIKQDTVYKERGVYKQEPGDNYLFYYGEWLVAGTEPNADTTSYSKGVMNQGEEFCPELLTAQWHWYSGTWDADDDAEARCSDCTLYPEQPECEICCEEVELSSQDTAFPTSGYGDMGGIYARYTDTPTSNERNVYKHQSEDYCLFYSIGAWRIGVCGSVGTGSAYMKTTDTTKKCAHGSGPTWSYGSTTDATMAVACNGDQPTLPPAPPTEAPPTAGPPTAGPPTAGPPTAGPPTMQPGDCMPCKEITSGPEDLMGMYLLDEDNTYPIDPDCKNSCVYKKGDVSYCFGDGGYPVDSC